MDWGKAELKDNLYKIPNNWLSIHYFEALTILFRLENSLRVFVYCVLKDNHYEKWDQQTISTGIELKSLAQIFSHRKSQSDDFGYLGTPCNSPLMFLSFGELTNIITGTNWMYFKNYFPAKREIVKAKLDEVNSIRNTFAHFRPITESDSTTIKIYAEQIFNGVSAYLKNLTNVWETVPTNNQDFWFKDLHNKKTENIIINLTQSPDTSWVKITLNFKAGELKFEKERPLPGFFYNLDAYPIITEQKIKKNVMYMTESKPNSIYIYNMEKITVQKTISLVFSKKSLKENYQNEIKDSIENLISEIINELEMVSSDKLHKGAFVSGGTLYYWKKESIANTREDAFDSSRNILNEPEYWGQVPLYSEYVSSISKYPWMNQDISKEDFPF